jgi:hypothetical protein
MTKPKTKRWRVWLCRDACGPTAYSIAIGVRQQLAYDDEAGVWFAGGDEVTGVDDVEFLTLDRPLRSWFSAREVRGYCGYHGPLPKPGRCMRVTVKVPI